MFIFGKIWRLLLIIAMVILAITGIVCVFKGKWLITILCVAAIAICKKLWTKSEEKYLMHMQMFAESMADEMTKPTLTGALLRHNQQAMEDYEWKREQQIADDLSSINRKLRY